MQDVRSMSFLAVGRKYGVSDTAVRKWIRWYEEAREQRPRLEVVPDPPADESEPPTVAV